MVDEVDYVELGLTCATVCTTLDQGLNGRDEVGSSVYEAINRLTTSVKPAETHPVHDLLTMLPIAGLRRRSRGLSSGVNEIRSLDFSAQRTIKRGSPHGGRTSTGFLIPSVYVGPFLLGCR